MFMGLKDYIGWADNKGWIIGVIIVNFILMFVVLFLEKYQRKEVSPDTKVVLERVAQLDSLNKILLKKIDSLNVQLKDLKREDSILNYQIKGIKKEIVNTEKNGIKFYEGLSNDSLVRLFRGIVTGTK
jgi:hypothetical protein